MSLTINNKSNFVFNLAAPIFALFYNSQKKNYSRVLNRVPIDTIFSSYKKIIDIGCGTGALSSVLAQRGFLVTGVDPAQKMLDIAMKKNENKAVRFLHADVLETLPFEDKSFDLSIASYVAHGLSKEDRQIMYAEMNRITSHCIIIYDYNQTRSPLTTLIEWAEGGDYFNFIKNAPFELKEYFSDVRIINVRKKAAWYICTPT